MLSHTKARAIDRPLLVIVALLVLVGFFVFSSASLGLLASERVSFSSVAFSQFFLGIGLGSVALVLLSRIHYRAWKRYALGIFIFSLILTLLVFVPHIGFSAGGATRWVSLGPVTLQPAEFLKIAFVLYLAAFFSKTHTALRRSYTGLVQLFAIVAVPAAVLLSQPDTSTLVVMCAAAGVMYFAAGARLRDLGILALALVLAIAALAVTRPYVLERITTFFDPSADAQGSGYQIQQSLIAIGSGNIVGRGFGQSVQKFGYLPEPIGDSIFAVAAEEFGFIGSVLIVLLFLAFVFRSFYIATRAPDYFGALIVVGIAVTVGVQAFVNMAAMLGAIPLTGLPLPFMSHGGTAMMALLAAVGVVLNVSKYIEK